MDYGGHVPFRQARSVTEWGRENPASRILLLA